MTGSVSGQVIWRDSENPLAGASVRFRRDHGTDDRVMDIALVSGPAVDLRAPDRVIDLDARGRFVADGLAAGTWRLAVQDGAGQPVDEATVAVFDHAVSTVTIGIPAPDAGPLRAVTPGPVPLRLPVDTRGRGGLRGNVLAARDGRPVPRIAIVVSAGGAPDIAAETNDQGGFAFDNILAGTATITVFGADGGTLGKCDVNVLSDQLTQVSLQV